METDASTTIPLEKQTDLFLAFSLMHHKYEENNFILPCHLKK